MSINHYIKDLDTGLFLDTYGPSMEEMDWTDSKTTAFKMDREAAITRLRIVGKYFPRATIVEG